MRIMIGCDHGGFALKQKLLPVLSEHGVEVIDIGCDSEDIVRYPYFAAKVAQAVGDKAVDRGILICSTGIGMSILANRHKGVRASLCTSTYMAKMTRLHNDSNLLCLGGRITGEFEAVDILETWLSTGFEGGRHCISLGLIEEAEETISTGTAWKPADTSK